MSSIPLPSLPLSIEWLKLRLALTTIPVPQPMTSNPQPKPYRIFSAIYFSLIRPKSRYIFIQENRTFRKAFLMMSASQKVRKYAAFWHLFFDSRQTASARVRELSVVTSASPCHSHTANW